MLRAAGSLTSGLMLAVFGVASGWILQRRLGEQRVRAFSEWRITAFLYARGLPVPPPVAARYVRNGLTYRCDLITRRIEGARPISALLAAQRLDAQCWRAIGVR